MRILAKVPRIMTSWLPRRVPYWLKSATAHLVLLQVFAGRRGRPDVARRRDVVGGDRVLEEAEDARVHDVRDGLGLLGHALEVGRVLHIGRAHVPLVGEAGLEGDLLPVGIAREHVGVAGLEQLARDRAVDELLHFHGGGPDVLEIDRLAVRAYAQRIVDEIHQHRAGERIGHHQRRRGEVVGAHVGVHAALEVAVAGEHRHGDEVVVVDRLRDVFRQRARNCRCRWCSRSRRG